MSRIIRPLALLLALLLLAAPASADSGKNKDRKQDQASTASSSDSSSDGSSDGNATTASDPDSQRKCEPVGVQLTPPPPSAGIDWDCINLPGQIFLGH